MHPWTIFQDLRSKFICQYLFFQSLTLFGHCYLDRQVKVWFCMHMSLGHFISVPRKFTRECKFFSNVCQNICPNYKCVLLYCVYLLFGFDSLCFEHNLSLINEFAIYTGYLVEPTQLHTSPQALSCIKHLKASVSVGNSFLPPYLYLISVPIRNWLPQMQSIDLVTENFFFLQ